MKTFIFSATALALGICATAQTQKTITAPTPQPYATTGATIGGNFSDIDQIAVGNSAVVQQQGTANGSFISQTGANATNLNVIDVLQWGNVQPSISGHLNYSDIEQNGEGNAFTARQQGDENQNFGTQIGLNNEALVQQGANVPQQAENNLAIVDQDGKDNFAEVQQRFDNSEASIVQRNDAVMGLGNRSYQEQIANPNQSAGHLAIGTQYGNNNELVQMQEGPGLGNYAEANQGDAITGATNVFAQQLQLGELNEAFVDQKGTGNTAFQEQTGMSNSAVASQADNPITGANLYVEQYQDGTSNRAESKQNGSNNEAYQEQYGLSNFSRIEQRGGVNPSLGNVATSLQDGTLNNSFIEQKARNNNAMVDQTGNGQTSIVTQNLSSNSAPNGHGTNTATVIQRNANVPLTPQVQRAAATKRHTFNQS